MSSTDQLGSEMAFHHVTSNVPTRSVAIAVSREAVFVYPAAYRYALEQSGQSFDNRETLYQRCQASPLLSDAQTHLLRLGLRAEEDPTVRVEILKAVIAHPSRLTAKVLREHLAVANTHAPGDEVALMVQAMGAFVRKNPFDAFLVRNDLFAIARAQGLPELLNLAQSCPTDFPWVSGLVSGSQWLVGQPLELLGALVGKGVRRGVLPAALAGASHRSRLAEIPTSLPPTATRKALDAFASVPVLSDNQRYAFEFALSSGDSEERLAASRALEKHRPHAHEAQRLRDLADQEPPGSQLATSARRAANGFIALEGGY